MNGLDERFYRPDPEQLDKIVPTVKRKPKVSIIRVFVKGILEYLIKKL